MFKRIICLLSFIILVSASFAAQKAPAGADMDTEALWTLNGSQWELFTNQELVWGRLKNIVPMHSIRDGYAYWIKKPNQAFYLGFPGSSQKTVGVRIEKSGIALVSLGLGQPFAIAELLQKPDGSRLPVKAIYTWDAPSSEWIVYRSEENTSTLSHLEPGKGYFIETTQDGVVLLPPGAQSLVSIAGGGSLQDLSVKAFASLSVLEFQQDGRLRPDNQAGLIVHEPDVTRQSLRLKVSAYSGYVSQAAALMIQPQQSLMDVQKLPLAQGSNLFLSQVVTLPELPQGQYNLWLEIYANDTTTKSEEISVDVRRGGLAFGRMFHDLNPDIKTPMGRILGSVSQIPDTGFQENPEMFQAASVNKIRVRVTGNDFSPMVQEFSGTATSGTVQIPIGDQRTVTVDYLDSYNDVIRRGQRQVSVLPAGNPPLQLVRAETGIPDPVITPLPGAFLDSVSVSLSTTTGTLYYTLDGSDPKTSSSRVQVISAVNLTVSESTLLKAYVELSSTQRGGVFEYNYVKTQIPQPIVTIDSQNPWNNLAFLEDLIVEIDSDQPRTFLYYTLNGAEPDLNSEFAALPTTLILNETTEVRYFLLNEFGFRSDVGSQVFVKETFPVLEMQSSSAEFFLDQVTVSFSSFAGAQEVIYSLDGSIPDENSPRFSLPHSIVITESLTLIAVPISPSGFSGNPEVQTFVKINDLSIDYVVSSENQVQASGSLIYFVEPVTLELSTSYPDTTVYYSLDGSEPTVASFEFDALNPIIISQTGSVKLLVMHEPSAILSDVTELSFVQHVLPQIQMISPAQSTMNTFSGSTSLLLTGSEFVFYSLSGTNPETDGSPVSAPLNLNIEDSTIVKAIPVDSLGFIGSVESIELLKIETPALNYVFSATQGAYQDGDSIFFSGDLTIQFSLAQAQTQGVGAINPETVPSYFSFSDQHSESFSQSSVFRFKALHDSGVYSDVTELNLQKIVLPEVMAETSPVVYSQEFAGSLGVVFTTTFPADMVEVQNVTAATLSTAPFISETISETTTFVVRSLSNLGLWGNELSISYTRVLTPVVVITAFSPQGIVTGNRFTDYLSVQIDKSGGAEKILYTTDGTDPLLFGVESTDSVTMSFMQTVQLRAIALRNSGLTGVEVFEEYHYSPSAQLSASFSPALLSSRFVGSTYLSITASPQDSVIAYKVGTNPIQVTTSNVAVISFSQTQTVWATAINADGFSGATQSYEAIQHTPPVISHTINSTGQVIGQYFTGDGTLSFSSSQPLSAFYLDFDHLIYPPLSPEEFLLSDINQPIELSHVNSNDFRFQYRGVDVYGFSSVVSGIHYAYHKNLPILTTNVSGLLEQNFFENTATVEFLLSPSSPTALVFYTLDSSNPVTAALTAPGSLIISTDVNLVYEGKTQEGFSLGSGQIELKKLLAPQNLLAGNQSNRQYYKGNPVYFDVVAVESDTFNFMGGTGPLSVSSDYITSQSVRRFTIATVPLGTSVLNLAKTTGLSVLARQKLEIRHPVLNTLEGDGVGFRQEKLRKHTQVWMNHNSAGDILISDSDKGDVIRIKADTGVTERAGWFVNPLNYTYAGKPDSLDLLPVAETSYGVLVFFESDGVLKLVSASEDGGTELFGVGGGTPVSSLDGTGSTLDATSVEIGTSADYASSLFEIDNRVYFSVDGGLYSYDGSVIRWEFGNTASVSAIGTSQITTVEGSVATAEKIDEESYFLFVDDFGLQLFKAYRVFVAGARAGEFDLLVTMGSGSGVAPEVTEADPLDFAYFTISAASWVNSVNNGGIYVVASDLEYVDNLWHITDPNSAIKVLNSTNAFYGGLPARADQFRFSPVSVFGLGNKLGISFYAGYSDSMVGIYDPDTGSISSLFEKHEDRTLDLKSVSVNEFGDIVGLKTRPGRLEASQDLLLVRKNFGESRSKTVKVLDSGYELQQYFLPMPGNEPHSALLLHQTAGQVQLLRADFNNSSVSSLTLTMSNFLNQGYASGIGSYLIDGQDGWYDTLDYAVDNGLSLNQIAIATGISAYYHAASHHLYFYFWSGSEMHVYRGNLKQNPIPVQKVISVANVIDIPDSYVLSSNTKISALSDAILLHSYGSLIAIPTQTQSFSPFMVVKSDQDTTNTSDYGAMELAGQVYQAEGLSSREIHVLWEESPNQMKWLDFSGTKNSEVMGFSFRSSLDFNTLNRWSPTLSSRPLQGQTLAYLEPVYINRPNLIHTGVQPYLAAFGLRSDMDLLTVDLQAGPQPLLGLGAPQVSPVTNVLQAGAEITVPLTISSRWNYLAFDGSSSYQAVVTQAGSVPSALRLTVDGKTGSIHNQILRGAVVQDRFGRRSQVAPGLNVAFVWEQDSLSLVPEPASMQIIDFYAEAMIDDQDMGANWREYEVSAYTSDVSIRALLPNSQFVELDAPWIYTHDGSTTYFDFNEYHIPEDATHLEFVLKNPKGESNPITQAILRNFWVTVAGHRGSYMGLEGNRTPIKTVKEDTNGNTYILDTSGDLYILDDNKILRRLNLVAQPPGYDFPVPVKTTSFSLHPITGELYVLDSIFLFKATEQISFDTANYSNQSRNHLLQLVEEFYSSPVPMNEVAFNGNTIMLFGAEGSQALMHYADADTQDWYHSTISGSDIFDADCSGCFFSVVGYAYTTDSVLLGFNAMTNDDGFAAPTGHVIQIPDPMPHTDLGAPLVDQMIPTTEVLSLTRYAIGQRISSESTAILDIEPVQLYSIYTSPTETSVLAVVGEESEEASGFVVSFEPDSIDPENSLLTYVAGSLQVGDVYSYRQKSTEKIGKVRHVNKIGNEIHLTMQNWDVLVKAPDDYIRPSQTLSAFQEKITQGLNQKMPAYAYRQDVKKAYFIEGILQGYVLLSSSGQLAWLDRGAMTVTPYSHLNGFANIAFSSSDTVLHAIRRDGTVYAVSVDANAHTTLQLQPLVTIPVPEYHEILAARDINQNQWLAITHSQLYHYNHNTGHIEVLDDAAFHEEYSFVDLEYHSGGNIVAVVRQSYNNYLTIIHKYLSDLDWNTTDLEAETSLTIHRGGGYLYYALIPYGTETMDDREIGIKHMSNMEQFSSTRIEESASYAEHRTHKLGTGASTSLIYTGDPFQENQLIGFGDEQYGFQLKQKHIEISKPWPLDPVISCEMGDITHIETNPVFIGDGYKMGAECNLGTQQMLTGFYNGSPLLWEQYALGYSSDNFHSWKSEVLTGVVESPVVVGIQHDGQVSIFDRNTFGDIPFASIYGRDTLFDLSLTTLKLTEAQGDYELDLAVMNRSTDGLEQIQVEISSQLGSKKIMVAIPSFAPMQLRTFTVNLTEADLIGFDHKIHPLMARVSVLNTANKVLEDSDPRDNILIHVPFIYNSDSDMLNIQYADLLPDRGNYTLAQFTSYPASGLVTDFTSGGINITAINPGVYTIRLLLLDSQNQQVEVEFVLNAEVKGIDLVLSMNHVLLRPEKPKDISLISTRRNGSPRVFSVPVGSSLIGVDFSSVSSGVIVSATMTIEATTSSTAEIDIEIRQSDANDNFVFIDKPLKIHASEWQRLSKYTETATLTESKIVELAEGKYAIAWKYYTEGQPNPSLPAPSTGIRLRIFDADGNSHTDEIVVQASDYIDSVSLYASASGTQVLVQYTNYAHVNGGIVLETFDLEGKRLAKAVWDDEGENFDFQGSGYPHVAALPDGGWAVSHAAHIDFSATFRLVRLDSELQILAVSSPAVDVGFAGYSKVSALGTDTILLAHMDQGDFAEVRYKLFDINNLSFVGEDFVGEAEEYTIYTAPDGTIYFATSRVNEDTIKISRVDSVTRTLSNTSLDALVKPYGEVSLKRTPTQLAVMSSFVLEGQSTPQYSSVWSNGQKTLLAYLDKIEVYNDPSAWNSRTPDLIVTSFDTSLLTGFPDLENPYMGSIGTIWSDGNKILLGRVDLERVLVFNTWFSSSTPTADLALAGIYPKSIGSDSTRIVFLGKDAQFEDILYIYNSWPTTTAQAADLTIELPYMASALYSDGTTIVVADRTDNRLVVWDSWPVSDNEASAFSFAGDVLNNPVALYKLEDVLLVSDSLNNRILGFPYSSMNASSVATLVIGQPDFESSFTRVRDPQRMVSDAFQLTTFPGQLGGETGFMALMGGNVSMIKGFRLEMDAASQFVIQARPVDNKLIYLNPVTLASESGFLPVEESSDRYGSHSRPQFFTHATGNYIGWACTYQHVEAQCIRKVNDTTWLPEGNKAMLYTGSGETKAIMTKQGSVVHILEQWYSTSDGEASIYIRHLDPGVVVDGLPFYQPEVQEVYVPY
ncbi:MAG: chitobiase/beta-hexosaminidase C-terminal domain-containing protein [Candidatus Cloacimonetes bacterium]|nr:chitobiase/beta-hexosaminidase C-terminal domain-containing protein [Candidatus Cloacimonadota bacterium]